jgi:hypothetical protein
MGPASVLALRNIWKTDLTGARPSRLESMGDLWHSLRSLRPFPDSYPPPVPLPIRLKPHQALPFSAERQID